MDTRHPHRIVDGAALAKLPEAERRHYVPLTKEKAAMLVEMTPEQRGAWLREHPCDADIVRRVQREQGKYERKRMHALRAAIEKENRRVARGMLDGTL